MTTVVIFSSGSTLKPYSVALTVADRAKGLDSDTILLDVEKFTHLHQGLPPKWFARLFGYRTFPERFRHELNQLGVIYEVLERPKPRQLETHLPEIVEAELTQAIHSDLFTYLRTDRLSDYKFLAKVTEKRIRKSSLPLYKELVTYFGGKPVDVVYIPNGRVAHQRLALLAAKRLGISVKFYEIGRAVPNSAYIGTCQIHDRANTQVEAKRKMETGSPASSRELAMEWLAERMAPGSSMNPFSRQWGHQSLDRSPNSKSHNGPRAVFFTSSADEFSSYGAEWEGHAWSDQFEAFASVLALLTARGVHCTLRVHPALGNKAPKYFRREVTSVLQLREAYPSLDVVWHNDSVSSYELVAKSDFVFVGRSTLGLESSLLGKCVWTTTPARYDETADVRKLHSPRDVSPENLTGWKVDSSRAAGFVSYWVSQDVPFTVSEGAWSDWNQANPPLAIRLGNLLVKNSFMHKAFLLFLGVNSGLQQRKSMK